MWQKRNSLQELKRIYNGYHRNVCFNIYIYQKTYLSYNFIQIWLQRGIHVCIYKSQKCYTSQ